MARYSAGQISIHTVDITALWFVATGFCRCLGLSVQAGVINYPKPFQGDEKGSDSVPTLLVGREAIRRIQKVFEGSLYKLVMRSDKPETPKFQDWVTRDVLPAIRKDSGYWCATGGGPQAPSGTRYSGPTIICHPCSHASAKGLQRVTHGLPDTRIAATATNKSLICAEVPRCDQYRHFAFDGRKPLLSFGCCPSKSAG